ncbi:MAG: hypothetical protein DHS80DRAFT_28699 [Piptocephalis tieghemiana]|nr:MAG: hypothetical protein DHS80DRAFT_28699 [Piptocephalis tieghemiana]
MPYPLCLLDLPEEILVHHLIPCLSIPDVLALSGTCTRLYLVAHRALRSGHRLHRVYALPQPMNLAIPEDWTKWLLNAFPQPSTRDSVVKHLTVDMRLSGPSVAYDINYLCRVISLLPPTSSPLGKDKRMQGLCLGMIRVILREYHMLGVAIEATEVVLRSNQEAPPDSLPHQSSSTLCQEVTRREESILRMKEQQEDLYLSLVHLLVHQPAFLFQTPHLCRIFFLRICRILLEAEQPRVQEQMEALISTLIASIPKVISPLLGSRQVDDLMSLLSHLEPEAVALCLKKAFFLSLHPIMSSSIVHRFHHEFYSYDQRYALHPPHLSIEARWAKPLLEEKRDQMDWVFHKAKSSDALSGDGEMEVDQA